jgi:hypothetical protein
MIFRDGVKVIYDRRRGIAELYDLVADPSEAHNLLDERPALAAERLGLLRSFFEIHLLRRPDYETPFRPP